MGSQVTFLIVFFLLMLNQAVGYCKKDQVLVVALREVVPAYVNESRVEIDRAFRDIGCKVEFRYMPYERSILMVSNGKIDGDILRIGGLEQNLPNLVRVAVPVAHMKFYFYKKKNNNAVDLEKPSSWSGLRICNNMGHRFRKLIADDFKLTIFEADSVMKCQKMLASGHVDLFAGAKEEFASGDAKAFADEVERSSKSVKETDLFIYLNSKHRKIVQPLERRLRKNEVIYY